MTDETQKVLEKAVEKQRGYADFFDWPDKPVKERGIVRDFIEALARNGSSPKIISTNQHPPRQEPPDFHLITETGERWGVELTELVSQKAIEKTRKGNQVYAVWPDDDLIGKFRRLLERKDKPEKMRGGPYDRYVLLIHTDEVFLSADRLLKALSPLSFTTRLISDIYVLTSYDPKVGHEHLFHLPVVKKA